MIRHHVSAATLTTLAVGGPVDNVVDVSTEEELLKALSDYPEALCIGGGSNLLVADGGYGGTIIRAQTNQTSDIRFSDEHIKVPAPVDWDAFVNCTLDRGLQGLEATSGVPGTVGGAVVQNLGAYGQEVADVIESVNVWDRIEKNTLKLDREECQFSYRYSRFKHDAQQRYVVTSVSMQLRLSPTASARYEDIARRLNEESGHGGPYPLRDIRRVVLDVRRSKGMLLGASLPSAGSFFTNPLLSPAQVESLTEKGFKINTRSDGQRLVSAAALMQAAGFKPGFRQGTAGLSDLHVLAIVNAGNGTATDIASLACHIRDEVATQFDVVLKPEPVLLGFDTDPFA